MYKYLKSRRALYVEDDLDVLNNITALLQNYFHKIYAAPSAEVAFDIFVKEPIDVLLVDIELPGINGIELIKKIRATQSDIPVVIISAYTKTDYLLESVELKLDKYIVKPFTSKKLYELLEKLNEDFQKEDCLLLNAQVSICRSDSSVRFDDNKYILSARELFFLEVLIEKEFISYDEIDTIWDDFSPTPSAIRSFVKTLRKKLPTNTLKNRQNLGYYV